MLAQQLINEGNLPAALTALQETVRNDPSNAKHRVFLFQLLTVLGNWPRALTQLDVAGKLDATTMPMVQPMSTRKAVFFFKKNKYRKAQ